MRIFHFTEQPYPDAWTTTPGSLTVDLPNRLCDPKVAADLFQRYYDEWQLADELGLDIMVNEHHSTATCMAVSANVVLGILARTTKKARLLALGEPLANRFDPLRVAEELAMIDVISRGRVEMGFVKGVPHEVFISNANPVGMMERLWEAHDLILKAMTTQDGPFSWDGKHFRYRSVNIWPRPYQQPHPPVWITAGSPSSVAPVAAKGYVVACFTGGVDMTKKTYDTYRDVRRKMGAPPPAPDRFAYLALVAVAANHDEAMRRAEHLADYVRNSGRARPPHLNPPGYASVADNARMLLKPGDMSRRTLTGRSGRSINYLKASADEMVDACAMFAGTPDEVYEQIAYFSDSVGGLGNLLAMCQGGTISAADTADSITLLAKEVLPRLKETHPADRVREAAE